MRTPSRFTVALCFGVAGLWWSQDDAGAQQAPTKRLPPRAAIHLEGKFLNETGLMERKECRSVFRITAAEVRRHFERWVEIGGMQYDLGSYVYLNCGRSGTARVDGKTYTWAVHPEDTMTTSWPDGKVHWYVRRILNDDE